MGRHKKRKTTLAKITLKQKMKHRNVTLKDAEHEQNKEGTEIEKVKKTEPDNKRQEENENNKEDHNTRIPVRIKL